MSSKKTARQRAIMRRNLFLICAGLALVLVAVVVISVFNWIFTDSSSEKGNNSPTTSSTDKPSRIKITVGKIGFLIMIRSFR